VKTYTAYEMSKSPQKIYRAADKDGAVLINHGNYDDIVFVLTARERGKEHEFCTSDSDAGE